LYAESAHGPAVERPSGARQVRAERIPGGRSLTRGFRHSHCCEVGGEEGSSTPRSCRHLPPWVPVHATNRGVDKRQLFFQPADYEAFLSLVAEGTARYQVDVFGYNVMPNHFHLLLRQRSEGAISAFLHRLVGGSACYYRRATSSVGLGHVYQRRYWSHVVADERHYLTALHYVEDNARQARLVLRAEDWRWGSLWERVTGNRSLLAPSLVPLPAKWVDLVNTDQSSMDLQPFRTPTRGRTPIQQETKRHWPGAPPPSVP
jgi:putative transposase